MGKLAVGLGAIALTALSFAGCSRPTVSSSYNARGRATAESWEQLASLYAKAGLDNPGALAHAADRVDSLTLEILLEPSIGKYVPDDTLLKVPAIGSLNGANFDSLFTTAIARGNSTRDSLVLALEENNPSGIASKALELRMTARSIFEYSIGYTVAQDLDGHLKK